MFILYCVLKFSQSIPSCFLAAFGIRRSDLADLLVMICIGNCKVFYSGVFQYTFKDLKKSFPSSLAL